MQRAVEAAEFLSLSEDPDWIVVDVRAPREYGDGHLPGAVNIPLFDDEERARVGTAYKQQGREAAFLLGLDLVGPKMSGFVRRAAELSPKGKLLVHCWRGGMRSGSLATLWRQAGFQVVTLEGGYKAYRSYIRQELAQPWKLLLIGGMTGSGKTHILHALAGRGAQVLDLEALAKHKGSAFGSIGMPPQGTNEQFENDLYAALRTLKREEVVWVEDESRRIGKVFVSDPFWEQMSLAPVVLLELPKNIRVEQLVKDYAEGDPEAAEQAFLRIAKRMDGPLLKAALEALHAGDLATTADVALAYYDRTYLHSLARKKHTRILPFPLDQHDPEATAEALLAIQPQLLSLS